MKTTTTFKDSALWCNVTHNGLTYSRQIDLPLTAAKIAEVEAEAMEKFQAMEIL